MPEHEVVHMLRHEDKADDEYVVQYAAPRKRIQQRIAFIVAACVLVALALVGVLALVFAPGSRGSSGSPGSSNKNRDGQNASKGDKLDLRSIDWGLGTASYQVEGAAFVDGREPSIWDTYAATPGRIVDGTSGNVTSNQYYLYKEDVQLLKSLNAKYYRFSLSWTRIIQNAGSPKWQVNAAGVAYYNNLINELVSNNIIPIVTLYHWDLPDNKYINSSFWLQESSEVVIKHYTDYAFTCFSVFGDRVKLWTTFNEPWTFTYLGYGAAGGHAPGLRLAERGVWRVGHNVLLAHAAAVDMYRKQFSSQNGKIFMALNCDWQEPISNNTADIQAAQWAIEFRLAWFADPIFKGDYPPSMKQLLGSRLPTFNATEKAMLKGSADLFGLNHYTTEWVAQATTPPTNQSIAFWSSTQVRNGLLIGEEAASSWLKVVPWGFNKLLWYVHTRYNAPEIWILENGMSMKGEATMTDEASRQDTPRVEYFRRYLTEMHQAIKKGVRVTTYIAWSLVDNFEWSRGFSERFGVVRVNLYNSSDQTRYVKRSAVFLRDVFVYGNETAASS